MWKLVIEDDEGKRTIVPLTRDDYSLGRKEGNTIRLTERNVSRDHAKLVRRAGANGAPPPTNGAGSYVLEDLTSYNGVYVNGLRVAHSQELQHGDLIQIGDYRIVLQDDAVADVAPSAVPVTDPKSTVPTGAHARAAGLMERPNRLVMLAGPTPGSEYPLDQERLTVGRAEDATISINHNSVSRLHCEIHALGDGRFEIVDKGSSNGVRVNASELRRGIVEAGDIIELGDVKFKFVGAGQIFRPGATESQQLAAIGERAAAQAIGGKKKGSATVPLVLFAVVVAGGVAAAWYFTRPSPSQPNVPPSSAVTSDYVDPELQVLADAKKLAASGNLESAHAKLKNEISATSKHRGDAEFHEIEDKWATDAIARARSMDDADKRKQLLTEVSQTKEVSSALRSQASDLLQDKDQGTSLTQLSPVDAAAPIVDAGVKHRYDAGAQHWDAGLAVAPSTTTAPTTTRSSDVLSQADPSAAMKARVFGSRSPAPDDVQLLRAICRQNHDNACVQQCNGILSQQSAPKPSGTATH